MAQTTCLKIGLRYLSPISYPPYIPMKASKTSGQETVGARKKTYYSHWGSSSRFYVWKHVEITYGKISLQPYVYKLVPWLKLDLEAL